MIQRHNCSKPSNEIHNRKTVVAHKGPTQGIITNRYIKRSWTPTYQEQATNTLNKKQGAQKIKGEGSGKESK